MKQGVTLDINHEKCYGKKVSGMGWLPRRELQLVPGKLYHTLKKHVSGRSRRGASLATHRQHDCRFSYGVLQQACTATCRLLLRFVIMHKSYDYINIYNFSAEGVESHCCFDCL